MTPIDRQYALIIQIAGLFRAERLFTAILDSSLKETGLTAREVYMLTLLAEAPGACMPMNGMTDALLTPKSVTTTRIQSLEKRGLVVRQEDREDRRRVFIILTAKGQRIQQIALGILMSSADGWISRHLDRSDIQFLDRMDEIVSLVNTEHVRQKKRGKKKDAMRPVVQDLDGSGVAPRLADDMTVAVRTLAGSRNAIRVTHCKSKPVAEHG